MKTYLSITFNSEGASPSEIRNCLMELGLEATRGNYDFIYKWDKEPDVDMLLLLADKIHTALKGTGAMFSLETI
ncbi:MAG: hypothetical protein U9O96_07405 [Candidatus Thermoplasmatota archaeon]|nr:hypothetical protein [Candidatus Thermoplasmatota archaeon]